MHWQFDESMTPLLSVVCRSDFRTTAWSVNHVFRCLFWPPAFRVTPISAYIQSPRLQNAPHTVAQNLFLIRHDDESHDANEGACVAPSFLL